MSDVTLSKLNGRITEKYGSNLAFAKELKKTAQTVSNKVHKKTPFDTNEIVEWCELLDISKDEITDYFFAM